MPEPKSRRGRAVSRAPGAPGQREGRTSGRQGLEAVVGEAGLKARIAARLSHLAGLVPVDDGPRVTPRLGSWPGWMDALADDLVLLCSLDPLAALRGLAALDDMVATLDAAFDNIDAILTRQRALAALYPVFQAALADGVQDRVVERAYVLLTEDGLLDEDDPLPQRLLEALGQEGRETLALRLCEPQPAGPASWQDRSCRITELLLAGHDVGDTLDLMARCGIEAHVQAQPIVEELLAAGEPGPELLAWVRRALLSTSADRAELDVLLGRCLARCQAWGEPDLAQEIRRAAFLALLDTRWLGEWLDHVPGERRPAEQARALHHVACHDERTDALLFLLEWPDLRAAARLVMEHHDEMAGHDCAGFNRAARLLEDTAPVAAMLLYRRGAFCRFSTGIGLVDQAPQIARCAELWARHPDGPYESHARFLDRLAREN